MIDYSEERENGNPYGHLWSVRLGHSHIPKTAGQSLGLLVSEAWGLRYRSIGELVRQDLIGETIDDEGSEFNALLVDVSFLTGHVKPSLLRELGRTKVFSVLRNPFERHLSLFAWSHLRRAQGVMSPIMASKLDSPEQYIAHTADGMLNHLSNPDPIEKTQTKARKRKTDDETADEIRMALEQLDFFFLGTDVQLMLDTLFSTGYLPRPWRARPVNVTNLGELGPVVRWDRLLLSIKEHNQLDHKLVQEASSLSKGLYAGGVLECSDSKLFAMAEKYGLRLT